MKNAGISRLNISLDTLDQEKYKEITGSDYLFRVIDNIEESARIFTEPTKINVVVTDKNIDEVPNLYYRFKNVFNIIVRFLQLTYKGDDNFVDNHRQDIPSVENFLPIQKKINPKGRIFTNVVAKYYLDGNTILSVIPQDHRCYTEKCQKLWYEDGKIFNCKISNDRKKFSPSAITEILKSPCKKGMKHRITRRQ
jgi:cyclic pyranopterin phosphate synthase